jgi:hypothetical protein
MLSMLPAQLSLSFKCASQDLLMLIGVINSGQGSVSACSSMKLCNIRGQIPF